MLHKKLLLRLYSHVILLRCSIRFWLFGPYGVADVLKTVPFPFVQPILVKYGAKIGKKCVIDTGILIHRPDSRKPFKNLIIDDNCYIGHNALFDLTSIIHLEHDVGIGAGCQFWTHYGDYQEKLTDRENDYHEKVAPITVQSKTVIYSGVIISPGVNICENVRVGAGSVILKDIIESGFYSGLPAIKKVK